MSNQMQTQNNTKVAGIKQLLDRDVYKKRINEIMGKKAAPFMASIVNVSNLPSLKDSDPNSIISSAIVAATLDLPIDQNLGFAYIVPYNTKEGKKAQFQMGYRGYIQLAMRTGQYKTINAIEIYKGEIKRVNRLTGEMEFNDDEDLIDRDTIVGYMAYFKLLNGFEKTLYMTKEEMERHAKKYSQSYSSQKKWVVDSSLWSTDFDGMAIKTVIKRLLSKYGILSVEMQNAITNDQAVMNNEGNPEYVDNEVKEEIAQNANKKTIDIPQENVVDTTFKEVDNVEQNTFDGPGF
ncbi:recombinase, phage RecT family protein [[Clostridium] bifermentans ATCC 638]|uniref:Recombinase, phage RecT family protein n=2 Tax=Clostridia TaxID=186801 RepID=T4VPY5_PARBF|nr:recombinase RecT [Paraclostridium bifermentans]EQK42737.1 recombinase, phage RecT family protein [[Clostridium] bifermentans ATCC 638] [Paraclostridium bifermentans ATCC 638 = DSM 14991]UAG19537.1 recombinase RecT [Paraclostridium bifermentans]